MASEGTTLSGVAPSGGSELGAVAPAVGEPVDPTKAADLDVEIDAPAMSRSEGTGEAVPNGIPATTLSGLQDALAQDKARSEALEYQRGSLAEQSARRSELEQASIDFQRSLGILDRVLRNRGIRHYSEQTGLRRMPTYEQMRDSEEMTFASSIAKRLQARGIHGVRTFRAICHSMDLMNNGICLARPMEGCLAYMGIKLDQHEFKQMLSIFGVDHESVDYVALFQCICGGFTVQRLEVVEEGYRSLCEASPGGAVTVDALETRYKPCALTSELIPGLVDHLAIKEFLAQWSNGMLGADGVVTWNDFLDYYLDVSMALDSDEIFCDYVCSSWGLNVDDMIAKKVFRRYATNDERDTVSAADFIHMLKELDTSLSDPEAEAWLKSIDTNASGDVSLQEFLSSKVLRIKRLFDKYDVDASGCLSQEELCMLFMELDETISDAEAHALWDCIDEDGSGSVSFTELLESRMLTVYELFFEADDRPAGREYSESEMKQLLKQLDPFLSDFDVHVIYKAIDHDQSGQVSFVELMESYVLKAKAVFDRYDTDRSRELSIPEFSTLLLDLDPNLSDDDLEALYSVSCNDFTGRVTLGDFLNPNVLKIKMLFDKYDIDQSRMLSVDEFKKMLKDLFKSESDKELEILVKVLGDFKNEEEVSFAQYLRGFRNIARRKEMMEVEKQRAIREKKMRQGGDKFGRRI